MFKDDPKIKEVFEYAKAKFEVVVYTAKQVIQVPVPERISLLKGVGKLVATIHLLGVLFFLTLNTLSPSLNYADLAMWVVSPMSVPSTGEPGSRPFTPLHTYFVATTGSNANNCLTVATACLNVQAAGLSGIVCGDVVLVNSGTATGGFGDGGTDFPTVGGPCPSISGGIDGSGGIYFAILLCAGPDVMSCRMDTSSSGGSAIWVNASNWAIEGFWARTKPDGSNCFTANTAFGTASTKHHVAFINDMANTCGDSGFSTAFGPSSFSFDQTAIVGVSAYDAANSRTFGNECGSAISIIPDNGLDTSSGTHIYIAGVYLGHNTNTEPNGCNVAGSGHTDGENIVADSYGGTGAAGYLYQTVIEQALLWFSGGSNLQIFAVNPGSPHHVDTDDKAQYFVSDMTAYAGDQDSSTNTSCMADLHLHNIAPNSGSVTSSWYDIRNSIVLATVNTCGAKGVAQSYAMNMNPFDSTAAQFSGQGQIAITLNYIWNSAAPTSNVYNATNNNIFYEDNRSTNGCANGTARCTNFPFGTNTYSDPGLTNIASLWSTAPDCTGYENVTTCMINKYTVDVFSTPSIAPTTMGYQKPGPCSTKRLSNGTNAFPNWLKGIVYLHASGFTNTATIVQKTGLITKPCGV